MIWWGFIAGKDTGIVETNFEWASVYWTKRALALDAQVELRCG